MKKIQNNQKGFTMVELLVVLVIVGILAAVATPIFTGNTKKAQASEAVATMSLIRQALRDKTINGSSIPDIAAGNLANPSSDPDKPGLSIDLGVTQYFSDASFSVKAKEETDAPWNLSPTKKAHDFVIVAKGADSKDCGKSSLSDDCAINGEDVSKFQMQMDNSGQVFVSYDSGSKWDKY